MKIYATLGDRVEIFMTKNGEAEARTVEGAIVIKDIEVNGDFQAKYDAILTLYPGAVVRFMKDET